MAVAIGIVMALSVFYGLTNDETRGEAQARRNAEGFSWSEKMLMGAWALIGTAELTARVWRWWSSRSRSRAEGTAGSEVRTPLLPRRRLAAGVRIPPIRPPNQWPDAQSAFMHSQLGGAASTDVHVKWWTNERDIPRREGAIFAPGPEEDVVRAILRRAKHGPPGSFVALWRRPPAADVEPDLVFEVSPEALPSEAGEDDAVLLGEYAPNGAMCLVLGGARIAPIFNPQTPWGDRTRRLQGTTAVGRDRRGA